jgi:hypothetical protein
MHPPKRGDETNSFVVLSPQVPFPRDLGLVATGDSAYAKSGGDGQLDRGTGIASAQNDLDRDTPRIL